VQLWDDMPIWLKGLLFFGLGLGSAYAFRRVRIGAPAAPKKTLAERTAAAAKSLKSASQAAMRAAKE